MRRNLAAYSRFLKIEHRRVTINSEEAANQNRAYQSMLMNGQHTEFNRLLGLGNQLLWPARAG
jgi:nitroimidazol reductase NimA-like FMN-containing flavoprotein (pyridoxamine 5'-phosphate oxidase superfamily)